MSAAVEPVATNVRAHRFAGRVPFSFFFRPLFTPLHLRPLSIRSSLSLGFEHPALLPFFLLLRAAEIFLFLLLGAVDQARFVRLDMGIQTELLTATVVCRHRPSMR